MKLRGRSVPLRSRKVTATTKTSVPPKQPIARTFRASGSPRNSPSVAALSQGLCAHVIDHRKMPGMGQRNCRPTDVETRTANLTFRNRDLTRQSADHSMLLAQPGISSDFAPPVDIVSPNLRLQILTGQDTNLAAFLLPDINSDQPDLTFHNIWPVTADARLQCSLSISEFVTAFSIYKRIMCGAYPQRSKELNWYLCDIVDIASKFGDQAAYEYHKLFSARATALLTELKIKVDWSYRDQVIFSLVVSGRPAFRCDLCKSVSYRAKFCLFNAGHTVKFSPAFMLTLILMRPRFLGIRPFRVKISTCAPASNAIADFGIFAPLVINQVTQSHYAIRSSFRWWWSTDQDKAPTVNLRYVGLHSINREKFWVLTPPDWYINGAYFHYIRLLTPAGLQAIPSPLR